MEADLADFVPIRISSPVFSIPVDSVARCEAVVTSSREPRVTAPQDRAVVEPTLAREQSWLRLVFWVLFVVLVVSRAPSIVQPAGGDQGLYAYIGQRIAHGDLPYRDAWDQKPPAIHYTYALMLALLPYPLAVPLTDFLVTTFIALLLLRLGRRWTASPGAGEGAALLYLLLGNAVYTRFAGLWTRAQCETFIALTMTVTLVVLSRTMRLRGEALLNDPARRLRVVSVGTLVGLAVLYKYNAAAYLLVPATVIAVEARRRWSGLGVAVRELGAVLVGFLVPLTAVAAFFAFNGAWNDLYEATVTYNLAYSGETYSGFAAFVRYLLTFPVWFSRLDSLWMLGGLGTMVLLLLARRRPALAVVPVWAIACCLSIAINGSRSLPQYFIQAQPALALAAGIAAAESWQWLRPWSRTIVAILLAIAVGRVTSFPRGIDATLYDLRQLLGGQSRAEYLERYGGRPGEQDLRRGRIRACGISRHAHGEGRPGPHLRLFRWSPRRDGARLSNTLLLEPAGHR